MIFLIKNENGKEKTISAYSNSYEALQDLVNYNFSTYFIFAKLKFGGYCEVTYTGNHFCVEIFDKYSNLIISNIFEDFEDVFECFNSILYNL